MDLVTKRDTIFDHIEDYLRTNNLTVITTWHRDDDDDDDRHRLVPVRTCRRRDPDNGDDQNEGIGIAGQKMLYRSRFSASYSIPLREIPYHDTIVTNPNQQHESNLTDLKQ